MASHIVCYPCIGPKGELKFALESFLDGKSTTEELQKVAAEIRSSIWKQMAGVGIKYIPSNTFSYYDQVLDITSMLGAVPPRYNWDGGEIGFDVFFPWIEIRVDTVPVLVGAVSSLLLSKPAKGADKLFSLLCLIDKFLPIYKEVVTELKAAAATWIQFDEPTLVMDLDSHSLKAFTRAYSELEPSLHGLHVLIQTYFADLPAAAYKTVTALIP